MERVLKDRLKHLRGKDWLYNGNQVHVEEVVMVDAEITVTCRGGSKIKFDKSEAEQKIKDFKPVETSMTEIIDSQPGNVVVKENQVLNSLEEKLMETIDKVDQDKGYVNQANSISDLSRQVIELNKTKIKMVAEVRKFNGG